MTITAAVSPTYCTGPGRPAWAELIQFQAAAVTAACERVTAPALTAMGESVERASCLPSRPGWERKAAAHAEIFRLLAGVASHPNTSMALLGTARLMRDLMVSVGPAANGMIVGSRQRVLAHLRAADPDAAAQEMESHISALHFMWRLAVPTRSPGMIKARSGDC